MAGGEPTALDVHKALADDTRFRLYRYLRLSGRAVSVRELATRLSLHPNTLRPHLRRLEEVGLVRAEVRKGSSVGRPQILYAVLEGDRRDGRGSHLFAEILVGVMTGQRERDRARRLAREWGQYLVLQGGPTPGSRLPARRNLAILQEALAGAGFDPRFRRRSSRTVEVALRECPLRELTDGHRDVVCSVHEGLLEGMLGALKPPLRLAEFRPLVERGVCRLVARGDVG
jgi:predicted ArsR family transcriptional regulator